MTEERLKKSLTQKIFRVLVALILCPIVLLWSTVVLLYIQPIQDYTIERICSAINKKYNYNISIGNFRLSFPLTATIEDFEIGKEDKNILKGEQIEADIRLIPLLKGEIEVNYISIDNTEVDTRNLIETTHITGHIGHFRTTARNIDLKSECANIRQFYLTDSNAEITINKKEENDSTKNGTNWIVNLHKGTVSNIRLKINFSDDTTRISTNIAQLKVNEATANLGNEHFAIESISLQNSSAEYHRGTLPDSIAPLDHLCAKDINFESGLLSYSPSYTSAEIREFTLTQKDGFRLNRLSLLAKADSTAITLNRLSMATAGGTTLSGNVTIPLAAIKKEGEGKINGKVKLHIEKSDLRRIITTSLYKSIDFLPDSLLDASMQISGNTKKLHIDTLSVTVPQLSRIGAKGTISNINDRENISASVNFNGYISDLARVINMQSTPESLARETLLLQGSASLEQALYSLAIRMRTGEGRASIRANYNIKENSYKADIRSREINLSNILPNVPLHKLTMSIKGEGKGTHIFDKETRYNCDLRIDTLIYDTLSVGSVALTARQINSLSSVILDSYDPNLALRVSSATHIDTTLITNSSHIELKNIILDKIGLTNAPLEGAMTLDIEASTNMKERHHLKIKGNNFKLLTPNKSYTPAPLNFAAMTSPDTSYVNINTGDLTMSGTMSTGYSGVIEALEKIKNLYFKARTSEHTLYYVNDYEKELPVFSLNINCGQQNIVSNFLRFKNIDFNNAAIDIRLNDKKEINGRGGVYGFKSKEIQLDTVQLSLRQDSNLIRYFAGVRTRSLDPEQKKLKFYSALFGTVKKDSITTNFVFRDNNDHIGARLKLFTHLGPQKLKLHFDPDAIILGHTFHFNHDNHLSIEKDFAIRSDIELSDSLNSGVRIVSSNDTTQLRDLSVELFNVDLKALTGLLPFAPDVSGILNADLHYRDIKGEMLISSDIFCNDIVYNGTSIGNGIIELVYLPKEEHRHCIDLSVLHNDNRILNVYGDYYSDSIVPAIDGEAVLTHFPLKLSEAFLKESGLQLDGYIDGNMKVSGSFDNLQNNGEIHFDSVSADAPMFGAKLHLKDDRVAIKENKLIFDNFDIYAHGSTPFKINGSINMENLLNPEFSLMMRANDYQIVNAKKQKGNLLYGNMSINFTSFVRGRLDALQVNGSATLLGKSNITYVMQETPLATENELDGLVQFVNFADTTQMDAIEIPTVDFGNLNMNITLNIEEGARINADFDENRSSYIELQGGGNLYLTYTSEAGVNLTGRYTLNNGLLKYTLPIIPLKTFKISDGSYINWTGDIMNPSLNITALERMTSSVTMDDGSSQAVAFDVGVVLTNTLDNMGLNFTLSAPENAAVQNELNSIDKETLNKYAVTMLITGAYLGSNGGITVSNAISSFLDARINDIAGNAMKSIDINVGITDVDNNETGGTYKNYSFSFTKRFWNNRLTIVIGGEVNSGEAANRNNSFINNVSLEWKLSEQGNRYIRLFYDKNYESILEGEITETGVGYIYKRKLDNLKELIIFKKKDEKQPAVLRSIESTKKEGKE